MKKKIKVLYLTTKIPSYRIGPLNKISEKIQLTVAASYLNSSIKNKFKYLNVGVKRISIFFYRDISLFKLFNKFDVIIVEYNIRFIDQILFLFLPFKKFKIILYGIGVSASYKKKFGEKDIFFYFRAFLTYFSDSVLLYSEYAKNEISKFNLNKKKFFVAHNTIDAIKNDFKFDDRKDLIFLGSLYFEKNIYELLICYKKIYLQNKSIMPNLKIIGEGEELGNIKNWIKTNSLSSKILLMGKIENESTLRDELSKAIVCISPSQAGLSVLHCMAYGVCFITRQDALTGGERLNIIDKINGIKYKNAFELEQLLIKLLKNKHYFLDFGKNAHDYFWKKRNVDIMNKSIIESINYVTEK